MKTRMPALLATCLGIASCDLGNAAPEILGQLESDRVELTAEFAEPIMNRPVAEGDSVKAGELVLQMDTRRAEARLQEADARLAQQRALLSQLIEGPRKEQIVAAQASLEGAEQNLSFRETEYERAQSLLDQGLASPNVRDTAKAALDSAHSRLEVDRARLDELLTGTRAEEVEQARAAVSVADAQRRQAQIDLERHSLRAHADSIVDSFLFEPGERPATGQAVAILLTGEQPYARVYIPEQHRATLRPGTAVTVNVDGLGNALPGKVRWVASEATFTPYFALSEHDRGRLSYVAKIDLQTSGERLPDGVPVQVQLD